MKIAHFIQRYPPALGGSEAYFARLSQYLSEFGDKVQVWTTTALDLEAFWTAKGKQLKAGTTEERGIQIRRYAPAHWFARRHLLKAISLLPLPRLQRLALPCNPIAMRMWYAAHFEDVDVDLVHASAFPYGWILACGLELARRKRVPFFLTPFLHLGDPDNPHDKTRRAYTAPSLRSLLHAADRIFAQTVTEQQTIVSLGVEPNKVILQGMGVDTLECTGGDRHKARQAWKIHDNEIVIGHLANQSHEKGTVDLLRAALQAWNEGAKLRVVLAGPQMPNFRKYWDTFPAQDRVIQLGQLRHSEKLDFYAGIDLFCLPSRSDSFGLVLLEAWANRKPVVAYRSGGPADLTHHGEDGLLVPCGDITGLADALIQLERDESLRSEWGTEGEKRIHREFCWTDKLTIVREAAMHVTATPSLPEQAILRSIKAR